MMSSRFAIPVFVALACGPGQALAAPVLGSDLASFAVLGATPSVTNTGATALTGDVGVSPAASITGQSTLSVNGVNALLNPGDVHLNDATAILAQGQLGGAITTLGLMEGSATQLLSSELAGLTLNPGVYSFATFAGGFATLTGTSALPGILTLDGLGDANATWVFEMASTLTTSAATAATTPSSVVNVINTGAGAGLFWKVGSSATIGTYSIFEGNILAHTSITMNTGATIGCGRALANIGAVTMDTNTISTGCTTNLGGSTPLLAGSGGLSGVPVVAAVPEPETYAMLLAGLGLLGFAARRRKSTQAAAA